MERGLGTRPGNAAGGRAASGRPGGRAAEPRPRPVGQAAGRPSRVRGRAAGAIPGRSSDWLTMSRHPARRGANATLTLFAICPTSRSIVMKAAAPAGQVVDQSGVCHESEGVQGAKMSWCGERGRDRRIRAHPGPGRLGATGASGHTRGPDADSRCPTSSVGGPTSSVALTALTGDGYSAGRRRGPLTPHRAPDQEGARSQMMNTGFTSVAASVLRTRLPIGAADAGDVCPS